jgi:hypothetical protein
MKIPLIPSAAAALLLFGGAAFDSDGRHPRIAQRTRQYLCSTPRREEVLLASAIRNGTLVSRTRSGGPRGQSELEIRHGALCPRRAGGPGAFDSEPGRLGPSCPSGQFHLAMRSSFLSVEPGRIVTFDGCNARAGLILVRAPGYLILDSSVLDQGTIDP